MDRSFPVKKIHKTVDYSKRVGIKRASQDLTGREIESIWKDEIAQRLLKEKMYSETEVKELFNRFTEFIAHNEPEEWQDWITENLKKR